MSVSDLLQWTALVDTHGHLPSRYLFEQVPRHLLAGCVIGYMSKDCRPGDLE
jgi:hypothetical protein